MLWGRKDGQDPTRHYPTLGSLACGTHLWHRDVPHPLNPSGRRKEGRSDRLFDGPFGPRGPQTLHQLLPEFNAFPGRATPSAILAPRHVDGYPQAVSRAWACTNESSWASNRMAY